MNAMMNSSLYIFEGNGQPTITAVMTASGTFVMGYEPTPLTNYNQVWPQVANTSSAYEIANPMVVDEPRYKVLDTAPEAFANDLKASFKHAEIITPTALKGYAERLTDVAMMLAQQPLDLLIVPYRGGLTPSLHLQVMNKQSYQCVPLGFTQGSNEKYWDKIGEELVWNLESFHERKELRIGIIDTAIRGNGSWSMANILKRIKSHFAKQFWEVGFHLLTGQDEKYSKPPLVEGIRGLSTGELIFVVKLHPVPSLLVEDWDEGIGLRYEWKNGVCYYKATTVGQVICRMPDGNVAVLQSNNLPQLINAQIASFTADAMMANPNLKLKSNN
jgi:hypothetical protein